MLDDMKGLLMTAFIVLLIASASSFVLALVLGPVYAAIGYQTIIGGIIALVLLLVVAAKTDLDKMTFFNIIVLFIAVGLLGSILLTIFPAAAPYIISVNNFADLTAIAWTLVYIGAGLFVKETWL